MSYLENVLDQMQEKHGWSDEYTELLGKTFRTMGWIVVIAAFGIESLLAVLILGGTLFVSVWNFLWFIPVLVAVFFTLMVMHAIKED